MALTIMGLNSLKPKNKQYRKMEGGSRTGFGVQVSTGGKISFIYLYRTPDKSKRQRVMTLGAYKGVDRNGEAKEGGISLKQAYREYDHWKQIKDTGRDPQIIRQELLDDENKERKARELQKKLDETQGTIRQLLDAYIDNLRQQGKRSWSTAEKMFEKDVYPCIPATTKARDVTPEEIKLILARIIERGALVVANRIRSYLRAAFTFGIEWDYDPSKHFEALRFNLAINPVRDIPKPLKSEKPRDRALSEYEVKQVWDCLGYSSFRPKTVAAIRLLFALGGQRVEEVLSLHTDDIDFGNRLITLKQTKNGSSHVVPFGSVAEPILKKCCQEAGGDGLLFAKMGKVSGVMSSSTLSHATKKLCPRIDIPHFQPKDARRTVKTLMGFAGIRKEDRDRFQNHALTDVSSRHYDRYDYLAEKREIMGVWDMYLKTVLSSELKY